MQRTVTDVIAKRLSHPPLEGRRPHTPRIIQHMTPPPCLPATALSQRPPGGAQEVTQFVEAVSTQLQALAAAEARRGAGDVESLSAAMPLTVLRKALCSLDEVRAQPRDSSPCLCGGTVLCVCAQCHRVHS